MFVLQCRTRVHFSNFLHGGLFLSGSLLLWLHCRRRGIAASLCLAFAGQWAAVHWKISGKKRVWMQDKVSFLLLFLLRETNLFYSDTVDGILGLGPYTDSPSAFPNFIDIGFTEGASFESKLHGFSICFGLHDGYFSLNTFNYDLHTIENNQN